MTIKEALEIADKQIQEENRIKFWSTFDMPMFLNNNPNNIIINPKDSNKLQ